MGPIFHFFNAFILFSLASTISGCMTAVGPQTEPIRPPSTAATTMRASYYADSFHGKQTAEGGIYDQNELTAAHRTLPFGTRLKVTNPKNGRSVTVNVNDRGPFAKGRELDLSRAAAEKLGILEEGVQSLQVENLKEPETSKGQEKVSGPRES